MDLNTYVNQTMFKSFENNFTTKKVYDKMQQLLYRQKDMNILIKS